MKSYTPFSNGSEACSWYAGNCEGCKPKCPEKRNIDMSFVSGTITMRTAKIIGYTYIGEQKNGNFVHLNPQCNLFNKYIRPKKKTNKNQKTLF